MANEKLAFFKTIYSNDSVVSIDRFSPLCIKKSRNIHSGFFFRLGVDFSFVSLISLISRSHPEILFIFVLCHIRCSPKLTIYIFKVICSYAHNCTCSRSPVAAILLNEMLVLSFEWIDIFRKMWTFFETKEQKEWRWNRKINENTITITKQKLTDVLRKCMQNRLTTNWFMALKCFCGGA